MAATVGSAVGAAVRVRVEHCYNIVFARGGVLPSAAEAAKTAEVLSWLLRETFAPLDLGTSSFLGDAALVVEVGPRASFASAWSLTTTAPVFSSFGG